MVVQFPINPFAAPRDGLLSRQTLPRGAFALKSSCSISATLSPGNPALLRSSPPRWSLGSAPLGCQLLSGFWAARSLRLPSSFLNAPQPLPLLEPPRCFKQRFLISPSARLLAVPFRGGFCELFGAAEGLFTSPPFLGAPRQVAEEVPPGHSHTAPQRSLLLAFLGDVKFPTIHQQGHGLKKRRGIVSALVNDRKSNPDAPAVSQRSSIWQQWFGSSLGEEGQGDGPPFHIRAPGQRVVAVGDLHGDWDQTVAALRLAGVLSLEGKPRWVGGTSILVQVGDILDRGEDEIAIMSLLSHLGKEAQSDGGAVYQVNGNHETMNVAEEFRYVTDGGFIEAEEFVQFCDTRAGGDWQLAFDQWCHVSQTMKAERKKTGMGSHWAATLGAWNPWQAQRRVKARSLLFRPGGPLACQLARHGCVIRVNDTLFAHGGILPHHVDYGLSRMNCELSRWMCAEADEFGAAAPMPFVATRGFNSVVWSRLYSREDFPSVHDHRRACATLTSALDACGAARLVVGHTPQMSGANSECHGRVWRIDVGMSSGILNAPPQVLEVMGNRVTVLAAEGLTEAFAESF